MPPPPYTGETVGGMPALAVRALSDLGWRCRCRVELDRLLCDCTPVGAP